MCEEQKTNPDKCAYSSAEFEDFMQQAELSGISPERQNELISMLLAEDISLEEVLLDIGKDIMGALNRHKFAILVAMLVFGLFGFVIFNEYTARTGETEFQPWQFEMTAFIKHWQIKV